MSDIPTAEQLYQEELKNVNEQETYDYQKKLVVEEISKINKNNSSVCVCFKAHPHHELVKEIEENGYQIKFEVMYDSSKVEKYQTRMRVINPKFVTGAGNFMDKLEDQMKGCAFAQSNVQMSEDTKKLMESLFNSFMGK